MRAAGNDGVLGDLLPHVEVLLPNDDEVRRIANRNSVEEALDVLCGTVPLIAVKCGRNGALVQHGERRIAVPGLPVEPVDTIGVGETASRPDFFQPGWAALLRKNVLKAGNIRGALSTQRPGGTEAFRDRAFVTEFLRWNPLPRRQP